MFVQQDSTARNKWLNQKVHKKWNNIHRSSKRSMCCNKTKQGPVIENGCMVWKQRVSRQKRMLAKRGASRRQRRRLLDELDDAMADPNELWYEDYGHFFDQNNHTSSHGKKHTGYRSPWDASKVARVVVDIEMFEARVHHWDDSYVPLCLPGEEYNKKVASLRGSKLRGSKLRGRWYEPQSREDEDADLQLAIALSMLAEEERVRRVRSLEDALLQPQRQQQTEIKKPEWQLLEMARAHVRVAGSGTRHYPVLQVNLNLSDTRCNRHNDRYSQQPIHVCKPLMVMSQLAWQQYSHDILHRCQPLAARNKQLHEWHVSGPHHKPPVNVGELLYQHSPSLWPVSGLICRFLGYSRIQLKTFTAVIGISSSSWSSSSPRKLPQKLPQIAPVEKPLGSALVRYMRYDAKVESSYHHTMVKDLTWQWGQRGSYPVFLPRKRTAGGNSVRRHLGNGPYSGSDADCDLVYEDFEKCQCCGTWHRRRFRRLTSS